MSSFAVCRRALFAHNLYARSLATTVTSPTPATTPPSSPSSTIPETSESEPITHYKVTLRRSAISLGDKIKGTLLALGIHRRNQTVYHKHSPDIAGKILKLKELVEVENVPAHAVRNEWEQKQDRKAVRGYKVVGNKRDAFMHV